MRTIFAGMALLCLAGSPSAQEAATDREFRRFPPPETELSAVKNVNIAKIRGAVTLNFDHETVPAIDDGDYESYDEETLAELGRRRLEDLSIGLRKYGLELKRTEQRVQGIFVSRIRHAATGGTRKSPADQATQPSVPH